jgi:hypothetical protein
MKDPLHHLQDPCDAGSWKTDETKTLQIEINGRWLSPRRCEIRHATRGIGAVRFQVKVDEIKSLTVEDAAAWRLTVHDQGKPFGTKNGWKIGGIETAGESCHICLKPA